ncbi:hypothetical protein Tco_1550183, partial [Tanacetum coccineum]
MCVSSARHKAAVLLVGKRKKTMNSGAWCWREIWGKMYSSLITG